MIWLWPQLSLKVLVSLRSHWRYLRKVCCPPPSHWLVSLHRQSDNRTDTLIKAQSLWIGTGRVPFCTSFNPSSITPSPFSLTFLQALNASFDLTDVCLWSAQIQIEFPPLLFTKDVKEQEKDVLCLVCMVPHSFVNGCGLERLVQKLWQFSERTYPQRSDPTNKQLQKD